MKTIIITTIMACAFSFAAGYYTAGLRSALNANLVLERAAYRVIDKTNVAPVKWALKYQTMGAE